MSSTAAAMPPGPPLPPLAQTLGFIFGGRRYLGFLHRRYGGAVAMATVFDRGFVMVFDPELVREIFQGPHEQLNAGEANAVLGPILGDRSVLLLDGAEHLRHRRMMLPALHGARMRAYEDGIRAAADAAIDGWPLGDAFPALASLQSLTLSIIVNVVFGYDRGADADALTTSLRAMLDPITAPRGLLGLFVLPRLGLDDSRRRFVDAQRRVDELLYAEIARRRADPELESRDDIFAALLTATDADGEPLSDREVRDELVTLLVAGHETTATGLAWALDLLLHHPEALERARTGDPAYLDAVVKETLRIRPVIAAVGRVVRGSPFRLGEWEIPAGTELNPAIRVIHDRADLYPEPRAFRPERFLDPDRPVDTFAWLPYGGGARRCLGASFAQMEMRLVLERILARTTLETVSEKPEEAVFRAITLAPKRGVRVRLLRRSPAPDG